YSDSVTPGFEVVRSPSCTLGKLNVSWLNTRARKPSSGAFVQSSSGPSQCTGAERGRSPVNGDRYMHSMIDSSCRSPLGRKRYTMRLYAPHGWKFGNSV